VTPRPLLSVVVPTCGRSTLARTLASIRGQAPARETEIIVVGDVHAGTWRKPLAAVPAVCAEYGARYVEWDGGVHAWGQPQRGYGAQQARGRWLAWSQDDMAFEPGAWQAIRASVLDGEPCPRLFKVIPRCGLMVWNSRQLTAGHVDADCLVVKNDPHRLGTWTPIYTGDADMIAETVGLWQGQVRWEETVIAQGRP
jgi:hypothetical protein